MATPSAAVGSLTTDERATILALVASLPDDRLLGTVYGHEAMLEDRLTPEVYGILSRYCEEVAETWNGPERVSKDLRSGYLAAAGEFRQKAGSAVGHGGGIRQAVA